LRFPAGFDDVAVGILFYEFNGGIEGVEILVGNDSDAGLLQFLLTEGAIVLQIVSISGSANNGLTSGAQGLCFGALAEGVVENDDIGPLHVFFIIAGLGHETIGDVSFLFVFNVVADLVAFFNYLPGDVADQTGKRGK
jgi:hypothetical protein